MWSVSTRCAVVPPAGLYGVVGTGVLWGISTRCAVVPPAGLYGVVGTGLLWDVSTLCAVVPPAGLYGVVGTGVLWDVSTRCALVPPPGLYGAWCLLFGLCFRGWSSHASPCLDILTVASAMARWRESWTRETRAGCVGKSGRDGEWIELRRVRCQRSIETHC
jgi:hypothetical protein